MISIFGNIQPPAALGRLPNTSTKGQGLFEFISIIIRLASTVAGLLFLMQIIMAGFGYLSASGDEKKVTAAWDKIWQSLIGLGIVAGAFIIVAVVERITGIKITNPDIPSP